MTTSSKLNDSAPQVENLREMLQFQNKAIVSRMLAKNAGGSVTLFAFDGGEGLSEHTAPYDALVLSVEGSATVMLNGTDFTLNEGDSLFMPANAPHAIHPQGCFKMLLVMLKQARPEKA